MHTDYWLSRWKEDKIGFHSNEVNSHLIRHWPYTANDPSMRVLVPLCGKSLDMLWLSEQHHSIVGVEVSEKACRTFFDENRIPYETSSMGDFLVFESERIQLWCGDYFRLTESICGTFDACFDRASLVALPEDQRIPYVHVTDRLLKPGTKTLLISFSYEQDIMSGPPFSIPEENIRELYARFFHIHRLESEDIIEYLPNFKERGLPWLYQESYLLIKDRTENM